MFCAYIGQKRFAIYPRRYNTALIIVAYWRHMASGILGNTDSGDGLVPWRNQTITWTNVDLPC